jgi:hypothetical protein
MGKQKAVKLLGERTNRIDGKQYALYNPCRFEPRLAVQLLRETASRAKAARRSAN